jgi:hypothetical protein
MFVFPQPQLYAFTDPDSQAKGVRLSLLHLSSTAIPPKGESAKQHCRMLPEEFLVVVLAFTGK